MKFLFETIWRILSWFCIASPAILYYEGFTVTAIIVFCAVQFFAVAGHDSLVRYYKDKSK